MSTKRFLRSYVAYYRGNRKALWVNILYCIVMGIAVWLVTKKSPHLFFIGYVMGDPVSYYVYRFRKILEDERNTGNIVLQK